MIRPYSDLMLIKAISSHYNPGTVQHATVRTAGMNEWSLQTVGAAVAGSVSQREVRAPTGSLSEFAAQSGGAAARGGRNWSQISCVASWDQTPPYSRSMWSVCSAWRPLGSVNTVKPLTEFSAFKRSLTPICLWCESKENQLFLNFLPVSHFYMHSCSQSH